MNRPAVLSLPAVRRLAYAAPAAAGLALAAAVIPAAMASAAPAALPANCTQSGTTVTCTYTGAGTYAFTVPAGVSSLDVTAVGAPGGTTFEENNSGPGASVEDTAVSVSAGQVLPVIVGGVGANGTRSNGGAGGTPGGGGPGGDFPGGNDTAWLDGGGGGGYSGLFSPSSTPLVIAAGGGGGGFRTGAGGPGDTGSGGGNGGTNGGGGGGGGTSTYGGNGGAGGDGDVTGGPGADGASLAGGAGGISNGSENSSGGGGGGGYFGGGGGGGGGAGGGGGGGSSFGISGLTNETTATGPASVTITYTAPPVSSTTTALSSSANPSAAGQQVTYTATVSPAPDGGTVAFSEGGTTIGACSAQQVDTSTGKATCQVTYTSPGSHSIAATYGGDNGFSGSGDTLTQTVNQAATTTAVTSSPNPSAAGQSVTFTATVSASSPGAGTPTGTVTFSEGSTTLGTGTLNGSGMATFSTSSLAAGGHSITVTYGGDEDFNTSHGSVTQTVNKIGTTTTVATSANPSIIGAPVTYTATVGPASGTGTPTGTVTFSDGGTPITGCGAVKVGSTGTATCPVTYTAVGSHAITAAYSADATYAGSTSTALTQQVAYKVQLLYSQTSPNNSGASVPVKLQLLNAAGTNLSASGITFTVKGLSPSPAPGKAPTGTFTFMTLDQGPGYQLNVKTTGYPAGTYTLSFTVSGDPTVHTVQFVIG